MKPRINPFSHHLLIGDAINTDKEIKGQSELWLKVYSQITDIQKNLSPFLNNIFKKQVHDIEERNNFSRDKIILGCDHLGPNV